MPNLCILTCFMDHTVHLLLVAFCLISNVLYINNALLQVLIIVSMTCIS